MITLNKNLTIDKKIIVNRTLPVAIVLILLLTHYKSFAYSDDKLNSKQNINNVVLRSPSSKYLVDPPNDVSNIVNSYTDISLEGLVLEEDRGTIGEKYVLDMVHNKLFDTSLKLDKKLKDLHKKDKILQKCLKEICNFNEKNSINLDVARMRVNEGLTIDFLYRGKSGVWEGYTVGEHTVKVLNILHSQERHYKLHEISLKYKKSHPNLRAIMWVSMSLHDIGKYLSVIINKKDAAQLAYIEPIYVSLLRAMKLSKNQLNLSRSLMNHDYIGKYLKGVPNITVEFVANEMVKRSKVAKMNASDYFDLQMLYYISDAGSYGFLHGKVFETDSETGKILLKEQGSQKIEILKNLILSLK